MSKKKKQKHSEEEGGEAWLLPYSDLMTLLLAVFIVLFAVSKVDQAKATQMAEAFRNGMMTGSDGILSGDGNSPIQLYPDATGEKANQNQSHGDSKTQEDSSQGETTQEDSNTTPDTTDTTQDDTDKEQKDTGITQEKLEEFLGKYELANLQELKSELDATLQSEEMSAEMTTNIDTRGLVVSLNNAVLFDSGSADIKNENKDTLIKIAKIINELDNYIRIEGHTDNVPINTTVYPSNWELSTARAASVVRLFIKECKVSPEKVVAVGYGEYKPIADNSTAEGREKNRRIDIIVLSEKYNNLEK